jgi:rhamnosyl/mannosyltransferase
MKVLQVNKLYYPHIGGIEKHIQDVAEALAERVDVEVLVAGSGRAASREKINGVTVNRVPSWGVIQSAPLAPGFYSAIKQARADIYHLHFPNPVGELAYLAAGAPGKLVVTYHADVVRQRLTRRLYGPIIRRLLRRADMIMVSSPNLIESSAWLRPVRDKCRVVPFAIDLEPLQPIPEVMAEARSLRERFKTPIVLFVGRLVYYKGLEFLVQAATQVKAEFVIVGEGPLESELKALAAKLGASDRLHFVGRVTDEELPAYYHSCDILTLPSIAESEAFGFVQLEAHACGKPVVSTDLPTGVPYANLHEKTGLIVPPRDAEALAQAINLLLTDNATRQRLGAQAKARVEAEFSLTAMADAIAAAYEAL